MMRKLSGRPFFEFGDVGLVIAVSFVLRALLTRDWLHSVYGEVPFLDARAYDVWAREILAMTGGGPAVFYQSPLYPYVLAALYACFGASPAVVGWSQCALGSVTCGMLTHMTTRHFGRRAGLAAGLLAAFDRPLVFYAAPVMKETLCIFLLVAFLTVVLRPDGRWAGSLVAGVCLGLAALVRTNLLLLVLPVAFAMRGAYLQRYVPFMAAVILTLLPATAHNWFKGRDLVLVNSAGGFNFYIGNSPSALALTYPAGVSTDPAREEADVTRIAEAAAGRALKPSEVSAHWFRESFAFLRRSSWRERARLLVTKIRLFGNDAEIGDNYDPAFVAEHVVPKLRFAAVGFGLVLICAAFGVSHRASSTSRVLALLFLTYAISVIGFYVNDRYRLPAVVFLLPLAGHGLAAISAGLSKRTWHELVRGLSAASLAALWAFTPVGLDRRQLDAFNWGLLASLNSDAGHFAEATSAIERALAADPTRIDSSAYVKASTAFEARGDLARARELLEQSTRVHPDDALAIFNLGRFEFEHGDLAAAERLYESAARAAPWLHQPHLGLAILHLKRGRRADAASAVARGLDRAPGNPQLERLRTLVR